jgi:hypothetical protein
MARSLKNISSKVASDFLEMTRKEYLSQQQAMLILGVFIGIVFMIRMTFLSTPMLDRTSWKEIDYITISQNYVNNGFNLFKPTISWPADPPRVTAMEFPLVPYLTGFLIKIFGFNAFSIRMIPLLSFLLIMLVIYQLVRLEIGPVMALFSALMAGFMPLASEFSNMLNSYPPAILAGLTTIYFFDAWLKTETRKYLTFSCLLFSLTILLMPTELTILAPLAWLYYRKHTVKLKAWTKLIPVFSLTLILPFAWYAYSYYLSQHSIDVFGVIGGHDKYQTFQMLGNKIWYSIILGNIKLLLAGLPGVIMVFTGLLVVLFLKKGRLFLFYLLAFGTFVVIVAEGNFDAPYRQFCGIPAISALFGIGIGYFVALVCTIQKTIFRKNFSVLSMIIGVSALCFIYFLLSNFNMLFLRDKSMPLKRNEWMLAEEIKKHSEEGNKIITAGTYSIHAGGNDLSPLLYYYSSRQGWTLDKPSLSLEMVEKLRRKGAILMAIENISREKELQDFSEILRKKYRVIYDNRESELLLLDLMANK